MSPTNHFRKTTPLPQRSRFLTSLYPGFSVSGWFRRPLPGHDRWKNTSAPCRETTSRHCMPTSHTQQDVKAPGQLTPRRRHRTRASVGGWARAASGLSRRSHSRWWTLCRSLKRSRWREASRRWRAGSRSPAKTPRTAPARQRRPGSSPSPPPPAFRFSADDHPRTAQCGPAGCVRSEEQLGVHVWWMDTVSWCALPLYFRTYWS